MIDCIKRIAEQVIEELMDSQKYIDDAYKHRESHPELADLYRDLSADELSHAERLHDRGSELVDAADDHDARVIWDWETDKVQRWTKDIKVKHEMYR